MSANVTITASEPTNITTISTTIDNATATIVTNNSFRSFENGTVTFLKSSQKVVNNANLSGFLPNTLDSPNQEVRLVSIFALFGLLGETIPGIISVLSRRVWYSGKSVNIRRLLYNYYARPWVAISVGIVTYVTLRAGLINVGTLSEVTIISEYGVLDFPSLKTALGKYFIEKDAALSITASNPLPVSVKVYSTLI
ncbi:hypothetical protein BH18THE1_BH18THE1_17450 [soil metagenome]